MAKIVDADSHIFEQPGMWSHYMPASQRHLALDIEEDELGFSWLTHRNKRLLQCYISQPGEWWESYGGPHQRQRAGEPAQVRYTDMPVTYHDPAARRDALDGWGLDQQVLFPNWGLNFGLYLQGDDESERANIGAWNRWAADIAGIGDGRLLPAGHLSLRAEPEWISEQLDTMAAAGIRQVFLPIGLINGKRLSHPDFEHVWAQLVDLALVPTFHIGAFAERTIADGYQDGDIIQYMTLQSLVMNGLEAQIALCDLVTNGLFDRHPKLNWVVAEYSVGWIPEFRFKLDMGYDIHYKVVGKHNLTLANKPSTYLDEHIRFVSFPNERPGKVMDHSTDNIMFGSDYPHAEGLLNPLEDYRAKVGDLGDREPAFYGGTLTDALDRARGVHSLARQ